MFNEASISYLVIHICLYSFICRYFCRCFDCFFTSACTRMCRSSASLRLKPF